MKPKFVRSSEGIKKVVCGDNQTTKLSGHDSDNQLLIIEQNDMPGVGIPLHVHKNEDEIFYILEGEMEVIVGKNKTILKSGDMGFCPRGIAHSWKVVGNQKHKSLLIITPSQIENLFIELSELKEFPPDFEVVAKISKKYDIEFLDTTL